MSNTGNAHQNAVQLGHEAYRDGIVGTQEEQQSETINAVYNHTTMAMNMLNFGQYQILNNNTIFKDIMQFAYGSNFENYINENYDSSADYWKVLKDGNIDWDGKLDFYDENPVYNALGPGGILNPIGSDKTFISVKSFYKDKDGNITKMHGWGIPRGFAIDLAVLKEGNSVFSNTNAFLYSNSINTNNPLNLNTGNEVRLFGNNNTTYYGHLQSNTLAGMALANLMNSTTENKLWRTYIPAGTQIGNVGNTGNSTGPHLHWEYRKEYQYWNNRSK